MICKYFLFFYGVSSPPHFLDRELESTKVFNFDDIQFIYFFFSFLCLFFFFFFNYCLIQSMEFKAYDLFY